MKHLKCFSQLLAFLTFSCFSYLSALPMSLSGSFMFVCGPVEVTVSPVVLHQHPVWSSTLRSQLDLWLSKSNSLVSLKLLLDVVGLARSGHWDPTLPVTILSTIPGCRAAGQLAEWSRDARFSSSRPHCMLLCPSSPFRCLKVVFFIGISTNLAGLR